MFKVIAEVAALVLFALAVVGFFSGGSSNASRTKFVLVGVIAALSFFAVRQVTAGHELVTLLGTTLLMLADLVWFANTYAAVHGVSLFGWLQGHKNDADLKAEVQAAGAVAVTTLKADATVAQGAAVAAATSVAGQAVSTVAGAAADAVKAGVEQAVEKKL